MTSTKLAIKSEEILAFARLAGITLTPMGVDFPKICARATVIYSTTGLVDSQDPRDESLKCVPMYQRKYENKTGFSQDQLNALEFGFEGHHLLAARYNLDKTPEYLEGVKLRLSLTA